MTRRVRITTITALLCAVVLCVTASFVFILNDNNTSVSSADNATELQSNFDVSSHPDTESVIDDTKSTLSDDKSILVSSSNSDVSSAVSEVIKNETEQHDEISLILDSMTLKEKVSQMIITTPEDFLNSGTVTSVGENFKNRLEDYPVGGFVFFGENIVDRGQLTAMLSQIKSYSYEATGLLPFLCVDEEGGKVARVANNGSFSVETFQNMYYTESEDKALYIGQTIGEYLNALGFNVDFAPVADVFSNPDNDVIGERSFSGDPDIVCKYALAYAEGLNENGIFATYKHFPGHGATLGDTHDDYAYTEKTYDELMQCELLPFRSAAENSVDFIMVSHISLPNVIGDNIPVSLSYDAVTGILKNDLGYEGIIITDSMKMGAISKHYSCAESSVLAVKAGNDMILMPSNVTQAVDAIVEAVQNGEISEERINESVRKILEYKMKIS